jgi:hypothetical protein
LIALDCAYSAFSEASPSVTLAVLLGGWNWIPLGICYWLLVLPNMGYIMSYGGLLSIAIERLASTLFLIGSNIFQTTRKFIFIFHFCIILFIYLKIIIIIIV